MTCFKFDLAIVAAVSWASVQRLKKSVGPLVRELSSSIVWRWRWGKPICARHSDCCRTNRDGASPRAARDAYLGDTIPGRILPGRV